MKSFNAYGQSSEKLFGANVPVWCGVVRPIQFGGTLDAAYIKDKAIYRAGTPVQYDEMTRTFKPMKNAEDATITPNGYLYNDIYIDAVAETDVNNAATGAIVMNHPDGLMIDRTEFASIADTLKTQIPGVRLIRDIVIAE